MSSKATLESDESYMKALLSMTWLVADKKKNMLNDFLLNKVKTLKRQAKNIINTMALLDTAISYDVTLHKISVVFDLTII